MSIDEKIIFTIFFSIFSGLVWLVSNEGNLISLLTWPLHKWSGPGGAFIKANGTLRKYTKLGFSCFFLLLILLVWVFG